MGRKHKRRAKKNAHKEESEEYKASESSSKDSEEVSFDFSKVVSKAKGVFSSKGKPARKKAKAAEESEDDGESVNINWETTRKALTTYGFIFLLLIPIVLGLTIRMQTEYLPITSDWARNSVHDNIRNQITGQINSQYPNLPNDNRKRLVDTQFNEFLAANGDQVQDQINQVADHFKSQFQDDTGNTYMPDIDPYHFMRHARNIIDKDMIGDVIRDGDMYDDHMVAPLGMKVAFDMHPHVLANFYKVAKIFNPTISIMRASSFFPLVVMVLSVIPLFLLTRKLAGDFGALLTCVLFVINFSYLNRSLWGHADTDSYNLLFPILITWLFSLFIDEENLTFKKKALLAGITGLAMGLYSVTWGGWWFMLNILTATLVAILGYNLLRRKKDAIKSAGVSLGLFVASTGLFVGLLKGNLKGFIARITFAESVSFTQIKDVASTTVWPNVLTTVAELNEVDLNGVINNITNPTGNPKLMFFLASLGLIVLLVRHSKGMFSLLLASSVWYVGMGYMQKTLNRHLMLYIVMLMVPIAAIILFSVYKKKYLKDAKYAVLFAVWIAATIYASTKGIRFVMLMVPAYTICVGVLFGYVYRELSEKIHSWIKLKPWIVKCLIIVAVGIMMSDQIDAAYNMGKNDVPSVNDAWFNSLNKIKMEGAQDAVITSWWDFGHWFKWYADRKVTFDGASQNMPQAHWVGKALLTGNEEEAVGILRMLHCAGHMGFETLMAEVNDHPETINILNEIQVQDRETALATLRGKGISEETIGTLIEQTHCEPPEAYFIASGDMIGKAGVWAHFGSWDFKRAQMYFDVTNAATPEEAMTILKEKFEFTDESAPKMYNEIQGADPNQWISGWPNYVSGMAGCRAIDQETYTMECPNSFGGQNFVSTINFQTAETTISGPINGPGVPARMGLVGPDGMVVTEYENSDFPYSPIIVPGENGKFSSMFMDPLLVDSTFTKMYYLNGHGLKYFDLFSYERDLSGLEVYVYKVDWTGASMNQVFQSVEPEEVVDAEVVTVETQPEAQAEEEAEETTEEATEEVTEEPAAEGESSDAEDVIEEASEDEAEEQ